MTEFYALGVAVVLAWLAIIFAKKTGKVSDPFKKLPKNPLAGIARQDVQQTFQQEIDRINVARKGDDPATALADLGNRRKR